MFVCLMWCKCGLFYNTLFSLTSLKSFIIIRRYHGYTVERQYHQASLDIESLLAAVMRGCVLRIKSDTASRTDFQSFTSIILKE